MKKKKSNNKRQKGAIPSPISERERVQNIMDTAGNSGEPGFKLVYYGKAKELSVPGEAEEEPVKLTGEVCI